MKKNVFIFGLVLGTLLCVNLFYMVHLCYKEASLKGNDVLGYSIMVVVFSLTYFGIRNYRDKELNGEISFGRAFKTGALIAFAGSTIYVVVWLFYYYLFVPDFMERYAYHMLRDVPPADLAEKTKEIDDFKEMYKNPLFVVLFTYVEVLPVGLLVSFVSAFTVKRKAKIHK